MTKIALLRAAFLGGLLAGLPPAISPGGHAAPAPPSSAHRRLEILALELANEERARHGLVPLAPDASLARAARRHSRSMRDLGFFGHSSPRPRFRTTGMRLAHEGVTETVYGENVGLYGSGGRPGAAGLVREISRRLFSSPVHRDNLLNPAFNVAGIGIATGEAPGDGRAGIPVPAVWMTQEFVSRHLDLRAPGIQGTPTGLAVAVGGIVLGRVPLWLRTSSPRRTEPVAQVRLSAGPFSEEVALPAGDGTYRIEICAGPDARGAVAVNALLVDTHASPARAIRSRLHDE